ncbi:MAG: cyclic nucleotide-binding domain-containing protein, partial [Clostridia bacterium]|nr:cyclic nucleotide-binding domain-containing protein [Clostridia bacterium]
MNTTELIPVFENAFPFWNDISEHDRQTFLNSSYSIKFSRGSTVHDGGECTGVILVKTGSLRLYLLSDEGKEVTLYRLFPGDTCILSASCVLDTITFDVFIDAEEDSDCVVVGGCSYETLQTVCPRRRYLPSRP